MYIIDYFENSCSFMSCMINANVGMLSHFALEGSVLGKSRLVIAAIEIFWILPSPLRKTSGIST